MILTGRAGARGMRDRVKGNQSMGTHQTVFLRGFDGAGVVASEESVMAGTRYFQRGEGGEGFGGPDLAGGSDGFEAGSVAGMAAGVGEGAGDGIGVKKDGAGV